MDERAAATAPRFDHHSADYARHRYEWFPGLREQHGPVFWSPHHGGFWVVIGLAELTAAAKDWRTFSSKFGTQADGVHFDGLFAPPQDAGGRLLQNDPPDWTVVRQALAPMFVPKAIALWRDRVQRLVDACLDRVVGSGRIDIVRDLAQPLSGVLSLELAGLPAEDYRVVAETYSLGAHLPEGDERWLGLAENFAAEGERILSAMAYHETNREGDAISMLMDARDAGTDFSDHDIYELTRLMVTAGLDTTAALTGSTVVSLARQPDVYRRLLEDPELIEDALDEFARHGTPTQGLLRTVTKDVVLGGRQLRRGDRVMLCFAAANRDPAVFPTPDLLALGRDTSSAVAFGAGIHKCLGIHFAKQEFEIVVRSILTRLPDIQVDLDAVEAYDSVGIVAGWVSIPATFTPGPRLGVDPGVPGWAF